MEKRFDQLLSENGASLLRLAASYTENPSDRDDLFQDIALSIWQALPRFRGESPERTFIFRIAHNRAMTRLAQRRPPAISDEGLELLAAKPNPEQELSEKQREERLLKAIHDLPIPYRQVIALALEGLSYADIAEILGIAEGNVGIRLTRARQMLRCSLEVQK